MRRFGMGLVACVLVCCAFGKPSSVGTSKPGGDGKAMNLGNFSASLAVKDLKASREFYEKLGFRPTAWKGKNWLIMQNETATIGLFQGVVPKNTLTFNPGWDRNGGTLPEFADVREIQKALKAKGIQLVSEADESSSGPASLMVMDPDGNPILIDQHVPAPTAKSEDKSGTEEHDSTEEAATGIGGVFFKAKNPAKLGAWYKKHLGLPVDEHWNGCKFEWREYANPKTPGCTVWTAFKSDTKYFGGGEQGQMINYRVANLKKMLAKLKREGVWVDPKTQESEYGKFGWAKDGEGNRIELWEPPEQQPSE